MVYSKLIQHCKHYNNTILLFPMKNTSVLQYFKFPSLCLGSRAPPLIHINMIMSTSVLWAEHVLFWFWVPFKSNHTNVMKCCFPLFVRFIHLIFWTWDMLFAPTILPQTQGPHPCLPLQRQSYPNSRGPRQGTPIIVSVF